MPNKITHFTGHATAAAADHNTTELKADPTATFVALLESALAHQTFSKLVLSKPHAVAADELNLAKVDLAKVTARKVVLKGQDSLCFVHTHTTRDITKNMYLPDAVAWVQKSMQSVENTRLATTFGQANLYTSAGEIQWMRSKKGKCTLLRHPTRAGGAAQVDLSPNLQKNQPHDREKHRFLNLDRAFLTELGVTTAAGQLVPAMARKWRQINKFIEVLDHALESSELKTAANLRVADFGSGKGYLTFAMHDYLCHTLSLPVQVLGVELRADMVALCNNAVQRLALRSLRFEEGDVREQAPDHAIDIMIALHACDTATDHAIHTGVCAGATIIMCSPCCHKELRPQLLSPYPLRPILKHGIHQTQEAEMLTDGLRALMLEACGYDTQVFEFIALEHTQKNKMILAIKRSNQCKNQHTNQLASEQAWQQVAEIKSFYGVRELCLEKLLRT
jgi:SAM-dependent methyltransferase